MCSPNGLSIHPHHTLTESLAYLTAATHGLTEETEVLAESLNSHLDNVKNIHVHVHARTALTSVPGRLFSN